MPDEPSNPHHHLVLVPHTHWDREWYQTHEEFRLRLVRLVDGLLDLLESNPGYRHFTLDGQAIVLDDYLAVRPEAKERIGKLIESGRLLVGPWMVLPDEWLVSGEALVRNLRHGLRRAEAAGGSMRLGYVPDQFGHVGQLPQIFAGFGFDAAVVWRGVGSDVKETLFRWQSPDGTSLLTVYLANGYGNAAHLPRDPVRLRRRLAREASRLAKLSRVPTLLLMNGSDHAEPDPSLPDRLAAMAAESDASWSFEIGTLPGFVERARAEAPEDLPLHRGEFRSGLRSPLLPGCASTRLAQKRQDYENDRLLTRYLEPLAAWLGALGGEVDRELIDFAWQIALENHPHDSICGCSVDAVHDQMDTRFARVREIAQAHLAEVMPALIARLAVTGAPATGAAVDPCQGDEALLCVWNPNPAGVSPIEAIVECDADSDDVVRSPRLSLRRVGGSLPDDAPLAPLGVDARLLAPARTVLRLRFPRAVAGAFLEQEYPDMMGYRLQAITSEERADVFRMRLHLGVADGDPEVLNAQREALVTALEQSEAEQVEFLAMARARVGVRFVDRLPAYGIQAYRVAGFAGSDGAQAAAAGGRKATKSRVRRVKASDLSREKLASGGVAIENRFWRLESDAHGCVSATRFADPSELPGGQGELRAEDFVRLVSEADRGDEYNFDPLPDALAHARETVSLPESVRVALAPGQATSETLRIRARYRVPAELADDRAARSPRSVSLRADISLRLFAGIDRVDVSIEFDNTAKDHRFRVQLRAPFAATRFRVESAFEIAERPIDPQPEAGGMSAERPIGATPQRRLATLDDGQCAVTVANRGLAEVEALSLADGAGSALALTLVRAVGWLSRDDLICRPMPAGPPFETPGAQVPGPSCGELSVRWHPVDSESYVAEAIRFSVPPLARHCTLLAGETRAAPPASQLLEIDDPLVIVSAIEAREGGRVSLRLYNSSPQERTPTLRWKVGPVRFCAVDLGESAAPEAQLRLDSVERGAVQIRLRPFEIFTLIIEPER